MKGAFCPINAERGAHGLRLCGDSGFYQAHDPNAAGRHRDEVAVAGQQDPALGEAPRDQHAVGQAALGDAGVVARRAQPAPEPGQHFIAEETQAASFPSCMAGLSYNGNNCVKGRVGSASPAVKGAAGRCR